MLVLGKRKGYLRRLLLADPVDRPELSRKVVWLPLLDADPAERPLASRENESEELAILGWLIRMQFATQLRQENPRTL